MSLWAAAVMLMTGTATLASDPAPFPAKPIALMGVAQQGGTLTGTMQDPTAELRLDGQLVQIDADGRFLIAFDRDAGPQARLTARFADGRAFTDMITIAPRAWRIEKVNAPLRPVKDDQAFLTLRRPELAQIAAARAMRTSAQGWRQAFIWPRTGRISGLFGAQRVYRGAPGAYHGGVDIAGVVGDPVLAPADGVVILAVDHPFTLEGNLLMIDHGHGLTSAFLHLSRIDVKAGQPVRQGQRIGAVGATGRATGPHLHWGLRWNEVRIDPLLLAGPMPGN